MTPVPLPLHATLQIGDFGVMRSLEDPADVSCTLAGTPYYVSPEICLGRPYSFASDVWSLGVLTYEMCALTVPFQATDLMELRYDIVHKKPAPLSR